MFLHDVEFSRCYSNPNLYTRKVGDHLIIHVLYVDEFILTSSDPKLLTHVKSSLRNKFDMIDLRHLHYYIGLQVLQTKEGNFLSWPKCAYDHIFLFHMEDCKLAPSPF
jgi:hypothetical protein